MQIQFSDGEFIKLDWKSGFRVLEWSVHPELNVIKSAAGEVQLEPRVMEVLTCLAAQPGGVVTKEDLIHKVWNGAFVTDEVLTNAVWELRKALRDDAKNPRYIQTIPKRGYRLIAPVVAAYNTEGAGAGGRSQGQPLRVLERHLRFVLLSGMLLVAAAMTVAFNLSELRNRIIGSVGAPRIESLAVLPLRNLSGDPAQEYLVDGMTESLIASLAQVESLQVISRTSIMKYKDSKKDLPEIAQEMGVDAVVEGSVLHDNGKVRITGQLIHAPTDRLLWAETYEGDMRDVMALQNRVTHAIVDGIQHTLTPGQRTRLTDKPVVNPEAYEAYLKGRYYYWQFESADTIEKAVQYFEKAIEMDPTFAPAYLGLADSYSMLALGGIAPAMDVYPLAKLAVEKALALDVNLGEAYATLSHIRIFYDWNWEGAENAWEKALELSPSGRKARTARLNFLVAMGEFEEAFREQKRIMELDALRPVNDRNYGVIFSYARQYEKSNAYYEKSLEFYDIPTVRIWMASNLALDSRGDEARKVLERALEMHPLFKESSFDLHVAHVYALTGERPQALRILEHWKRHRGFDRLSQSGLAVIYAALGEKKLALDRMERAFEQRCPGLIYIRVDPAYDPIRSEPRFQEMVSRMNFPS